MSHLLDTHAFLWWLDGDRRLSRNARETIQNHASPVYVSAASAWEISTKARIGRLPRATVVAQRLPEIMVEQGFGMLAITVEHGFRAGWLPGNHRDPFDRVLAAQAIVDGLTIITADAQIAKLGARTLW